MMMNAYNELVINKANGEESSNVGSTIKGIVSGLGGAASTGGGSAIAQAVEGMVSAISGAVTQTVGAIQDAVTSRRKVTLEELNSLLDADTNKWTNVPMMVLGFAVLVLLIYAYTKKQK